MMKIRNTVRYCIVVIISLIVSVLCNTETKLIYGGADNTVIIRYGYTGDIQVFTAPYTGEYTFKLHGASGGGENPNYSGTIDKPKTSNIGGKGGFTEVKISLTAGKKIYMCIGEPVLMFV